MAGYNTSEFKKGLKVQIDGDPYIMIECNFVKPGKGQALYKCKLRNLLRNTASPLTLAILDGLSVMVGAELFIVPLTCVVESLQPLAADVKTISGRGPVVHVRGEYLPVVALHEFFAIKPQTTELHQGIVVIVEAEGRKIAMFVDALVGQHQVVIKSLETNFRRVHGVSGATIMGALFRSGHITIWTDGTVALILDAVAIGQAAEPVLAVA